MWVLILGERMSGNERVASLVNGTVAFEPTEAAHV